MKKQLFYLVLLSYFFIGHNSIAQDLNKTEKIKGVSKLFKDQKILPLKLVYSNRDVKKKTNDSTYIITDLSYQNEAGTWNSLEVELRGRGFNRLKNCYFPPIKIKIKKSNAKGTIFKGNKKLKLVLPCLKQKSMNDALIKEALAYKLYEIISPYHFKTRIVKIDFTESRGKKMIDHKLDGILIEDDQIFGERHNGKMLKRFIHPMGQDALASVHNAFFQFMIANTDYSTAYQHNEKLFFINDKMIPVPYDFDMSGLVNASYAVVSQINNEALAITKVTERMYRGFKRDIKIFNQVRQEFLDSKIEMLEVIDSFESNFDDPKEFLKTKEFILSFFKIIENDNQFQKKIVQQARTK